MSKVDVYVNNKRTNLHWLSVYIRKSLDEICHYIEVELPTSERSKVEKHQHISVYYSNPMVKRNVTMGFIDDISLDNTARDEKLVVTARSAARDIIDSSWSDEITDKTLLGVVKYIADRFSIDVSCMPTSNGDFTKLVSSFAWENESPWQKLIQAADNQGFILTSSQTGGLYIWEVAGGVRKEGFKLIEGQSVRSIKDSDKGSEQYHTYVIKGPDGNSVTAYDKSCQNNRILTLNLTDQTITKDQLSRRAETEIRRRRERRITVSVADWGLSLAQLKKLGNLSGKEIFWETNFLTPVKLPSLSIEANLLTSQIEYKADAKSMSCDIQLVPREAYL
ncbi:hypothetical protein [Sediminispirochaeta bajacaliforniensis]|uniref:hypothetical protein n=1 Tax=Sediminispirochaeta bajacaliforniensis TaxID=148 RepID=UPI00036DB93C|nr:hypothetical protein [Sediminispirochaeta bajacaliforniensis]